MKSFRKACRGEKGFTLIELLVVIMILGVLAAVVTLAVTRFIGKGTVESANAELVTVQAAVEACLADANRGSFEAEVDWDGSAASAPETDNGFTAYDYMRTHEFKATYTIATNGSVTDAADGGAGGSWGNITWDNGTWT
jgi:prepilin-type N-terminal cleavage/methylation domain-containing protein